MVLIVGLQWLFNLRSSSLYRVDGFFFHFQGLHNQIFLTTHVVNFSNYFQVFYANVVFNIQLMLVKS